MELKLFRDDLAAAGGCYTVQAEIPIEAELLISDYLPQVFKIVKCFARPVVLQKQLQPGRLNIEGYLRCTVYYQGEQEAGLCQAEQKLPFARALELPELDFSAWSAAVGGETEYLNCRAVNPRRIEVRGAFGLCAAVSTQQQAGVVTAAAGGGIQQQQKTVAGVRRTAVLDKLITSEGELAFTQPVGAVLDITGNAAVRELRLQGGKAVVKGEVQVQCAWRAQGQQALQTQQATVPFNQVLDVEGLAEDQRCLCVVQPVGFALTQGENGAPAQLAVNAMLHLRAFRSYEVNCVTQAFSTQYEAETTSRQVAAERIAQLLDQTVQVSATGPLPDANTTLLACFASFGMPQVCMAGELPQLTARGVVTAFGQNSLGEIESYDKTVELALPLQECAGYTAAQLYPECWFGVQAASASCSGGMLEVSLAVHAEGVVMGSEATACVTDITLGEPLAPADPDISLRIYYAQPGEALFDIARRYHVCPASMLAANGLEQAEVLQQACRLLVPAAGG